MLLLILLGLAGGITAVLHLNYLEIAHKTLFFGRNVLSYLLLEGCAQLRTTEDQLFVDHGVVR